MTDVVVLLDPLRPDVLPLEALPFLHGLVEVDDAVPGSVREALGGSTAGATVLVTMDDDGPRVTDLADSGARIIRATPVVGERLLEAASLMDRLWSRGGWEAAQTHQSLSVYLVEETYEVLDAIRSGDEIDLREELGDLLLQVLFHSRIAQSHDVFDVDDVADALITKLVHRSPHLTGAGVVDIAEQELAWERLKAVEKARASSMDGIALSQPPILLAEKVINRAVNAGVTDIIAKSGLEDLIARCRVADEKLAGALEVLMVEIRNREMNSLKS